MPSGFDLDPHSQDGQACPQNFFGITSYSELSRKEAIYVPNRALQLFATGVNGAFNLAHLRKIHWFLFRDVFPWAGELRVVGLAKAGGAPFAPPIHIMSALSEALDKLKKEDLLRGLDLISFAQRSAYYLGEINAIHPFREGNGRTQREFIRQLALNAGYTLSWAGFSQEQNIEASVLSHTRGDNSGLATIIEAAIAQTEATGGKD